LAVSVFGIFIVIWREAVPHLERCVKMNQEYWIFLRSDLPEVELSFFRHLYPHPIKSEHGDMVILPCKEVDASHHIYTLAQISAGESESMMSIMIPHHSISMIHMPGSNPQIGYLSTQAE
jgi:hypothetical protein